MKTKILGEPRFTKEALFGIGLSYGMTSDTEVNELDTNTAERLKTVARRLAHQQGGHNKFLESITLGLDIDAPRYWWQEFDTYRTGITKQSESTMHTIAKRKFEQSDFEPYWPHREWKTSTLCGSELADIVDKLNCLRQQYIAGQVNEGEGTVRECFFRIKAILPESYLQRRIVVTNCKVLQNMYSQRKNHKLPEWHKFFGELKKQLDSDTAYYIFGEDKE